MTKEAGSTKMPESDDQLGLEPGPSGLRKAGIGERVGPEPGDTTAQRLAVKRLAAEEERLFEPYPHRSRQHHPH
jgi:hypothetical protein